MMKKTLNVLAAIVIVACLACLHASADDFKRGDVNCDNSVNSDDAIYLLRNTLSPENYPIFQNGDVNRDGVISSNDAIYLLRYTLSSSEYPIECGVLGHVFENRQCMHCGEKDKGLIIEDFASDENYKFLGALTNGSSLQGFYNELDSALSAFHSDTSKSCALLTTSGGNSYYLVSSNSYANWGLSRDQAIRVWQAYQDDHPLYYWMLDCISDSSSGRLYTATYSEYSKGSVREEYNSAIYKLLEEYILSAEGCSSIYDTSLYYFDLVLENSAFAPQSSGTTFYQIYKECTIVGPLLNKSGYNSGYAKLYQLLLNYSGAECWYAWGNSPLYIGWNLVKLDDGKWYWFDLATADRLTNNDWDSRDYFCQTSKTLTKDHVAFTRTNAPVAPTLSGTPFEFDGVVTVLGSFVSDGVTYMLMNGFDRVLAIDYDFSERDKIKSTVEHNGKKYSVYNYAEYNGTDLNTVMFESDFCYDYLGTLENGAQKQALYNEFDFKFTQFHFEDDITPEVFTLSGTPWYAFSKINYSSYGLDYKDAVTVWQFYRFDHPMFYWSYYGWLNDSVDSDIYPCTIADFAASTERDAASERVYSGIFDYLSAAEKETNPYLITLGFYDEILDNCKYAFNSNGEAEKSLWAHSIIGAFDKNAFVCEGYAKLLEILLNYRGIENYIVTGLAGSGSSRGGHAWNLVRLDDGNWYWFDGTWGDAEPTNYTLYARYFCALDSVLLSTHSPYSTEASSGGTVVPSLPKRSQGAYKNSSVIALGDSFSVNGCTYKRVSYDEVECIFGLSDSSVEYLGHEYNIIKK